VTVSGRSSAYEGTVHVSVLEDRRGPDRVLGKGFVNGGAAELAPFSGRIAFGAPSAEAGWLVLSGDSGGDGGTFDATRCGSASPAIDMSECSLISSPRYE
jgi:hypothetical protein